MKNIWKYLIIVTLCLFLSIDSLDATAENILFVQGNRVNVRKGPGTNFPVIMQLKNNTRVIERLRQGDWVAVKVSGAVENGWIHDTLLQNEKIEYSKASMSSKGDYAKGEASTSTVASTLSKVDTSPGLKKVEISSEPLSEQYLFEKVGVVDIQRIIYECKKGKEAQKYVENLISMRSEKDLKRTEHKLINQIIKDITVVVEKYAREKGFSLIFTKREVLFFIEERFDITDEIIRLYDERVEASSSHKTE